MEITSKITMTCEDNMKLMARYPDNYFDLAIVMSNYFIIFVKNLRCIFRL